MNKDAIGAVYASFPDLLTYPTSSIHQQAENCLVRLQGIHPEAAVAMENFLHGLKQCTLERLKELYTTTFDMQPVCYPYIGYQLFGESYKRGALMAQLNEAYRAFGYSAGQELPDHLSVILRFLGLDTANREGEFCQALLNSGLIPALEKMLQPFGAQSENPYYWLLYALQRFLVKTPEKEFDHA
ncbi:MAG: nitrate reductase molybdenum cofactor assembly chaperone [Anaerolineales bacterium]|nr:nitrate reductase molybdenum cofactor assembly chaperone [Anaerolineae bacterium]PWB71853.1 MAG: nitrate reductase molybdenum cofactor assembly chaperone [Anaerolineales bacterium]